MATDQSKRRLAGEYPVSERRDIELPRDVNYSRIEVRPDADKLLLYSDEEGNDAGEW